MRQLKAPIIEGHSSAAECLLRYQSLDADWADVLPLNRCHAASTFTHASPTVYHIRIIIA
jgi:hypothetical protein